MRREQIIPDGMQASYDSYHFSPAVRVGDTVYVSGVIGTVDGAVPDDATDEFAAAFATLQTLLEAAGATVADIVDMTSFHTDMSTLGTFMGAKDAVIREPYPAWTAIGCTELALPGARAEVKVTAVVSS